jgi:transmembrane sensor
MKNNHSENKNLNTASNITAEACAWIAQLETGDATHADMEAFKEWVSRSPRHSTEIKRMAQLSLSLNSLNEIAPEMTAATQVNQNITKSRFRLPVIWMPVMVMSLVFFSFLLTILMPSIPAQTDNYFTQVGESKTVNLTDGSLITLNTDSHIAVTYSDENRVIQLLKGEAYFDVVANKERPFWVYTKGDRVRVVGTEFLIRYIDDKFKLLVTEGVVNLASLDLDLTMPTDEQESIITNINLDKEALSLVAGQQIELNKYQPIGLNPSLIALVSEKQQRQELSWQDGFHDFTDMALADVAAEVSRYIPEQVIVRDISLKNLKFSGIFRIGESQVLFDALEQGYGLEVLRINANTVEIRTKV